MAPSPAAAEPAPVAPAVPPAASAASTTPLAIPPAPAFDVANRDDAIAFQRELKRVGCYSGALDGDFGSGSQAAFREFLRHSKSQPAAAPAEQHLVKARAAAGRVCPLDCDADERAVGDRCVQIAKPAPPPEPKRQPPKPASSAPSSNPPPKPAAQPNCGAYIACKSLYPLGRGDIHCQRPPGC